MKNFGKDGQMTLKTDALAKKLNTVNERVKKLEDEAEYQENTDEDC
jgi:hypothetical protein